VVASGKRYAVYHPSLYWLVDTCAGGSWSETVEEASWFMSPDDAALALAAAEIAEPDVVICRVR
jgi:hypothetical protein